jgi:hypothetical protein
MIKSIKNIPGYFIFMQVENNHDRLDFLMIYETGDMPTFFRSRTEDDAVYVLGHGGFFSDVMFVEDEYGICPVRLYKVDFKGNIKSSYGPAELQKTLFLSDGESHQVHLACDHFGIKTENFFVVP